MKLKDELAELEARRVAFTAMANDQRLTAQERGAWIERLEEVIAELEFILADMRADPLGYLVWRVADDNEPLMKQTRRFPQ